MVVGGGIDYRCFIVRYLPTLLLWYCMLSAPRLVLGAIYKYLNEPLQVNTYLLLLALIALLL